MELRGWQTGISFPLIVSGGRLVIMEKQHWFTDLAGGLLDVLELECDGDGQADQEPCQRGGQAQLADAAEAQGEPDGDARGGGGRAAAGEGIEAAVGGGGQGAVGGGGGAVALILLARVIAGPGGETQGTLPAVTTAAAISAAAADAAVGDAAAVNVVRTFLAVGEESPRRCRRCRHGHGRRGRRHRRRLHA